MNMQGVSKTKYGWKASYQNKNVLPQRLMKTFSSYEEAVSQRKKWEKKYGLTNYSSRFHGRHGVSHANQMKDYVGVRLNGYTVVMSTGETDTTGNQILLVSDGERYVTVSANKFMNGWIPSSPEDRRRSYIKRKNTKVQKNGSKYVVSLTRNGYARRRKFNSEKEAAHFLNVANDLYIKQGKAVDKHIPIKISEYIYKRDSPWGTKYVFEKKIKGKNYKKSFKDKSKALKFEALFDKTPDKKRRQLMALGYSSSNYKYIHRGHSSFYFEKTMNGQRFRRGFADLESALNYRDAFLKEHNLIIPLDRKKECK